MESRSQINSYLSEIGRKGGEKSRRILDSEDAKNMVRIREAKRAFKKYYAQCFWFMREDLEINLENISEIINGLRQNGGRQGFLLAAKLCQ